jgi:hypothetical protein
LNNEETLVFKFLGNIPSISALAIWYSVHQIDESTVLSDKLFIIHEIS